MDDKLTLFYNSLTANPAITGLPEDIGTFKTALSDPARSEVFYNSLKANPNIKGLPDNYKDFLSGLSIKAGGVTPQQPRQPFFEGLGRKGGVSALSLGEMVTEIPQAVEAVANIPMNIFAGAMIKKAERKGEIDKETADFLREEQLYPKANFGQILPSVPGQESMGQALADSKLNEWFESNAEKLNETVTRYDQTATQYLKNKQFGNALGAISYGVAESIAPTLAAMLVPGGAAALGLGVGAQKYDEVKDREDMSEAMKLADSATSGIFEWLFEKFGSAEMAKYLKSYYNKVGGKGLQQAFGSQTMQNLIGKAYKKLGLWFAPVHEGVSEFATQIGQDLASKLSGESPDLTFQDIKANAIEAFLIGTGMGGFFSSTTALAKKVKDTVSPPSPLDTDTEPGAIGPLQVPRTQQEVEQIINEYGRNIKFGETPLEEDPDPMVSFAQTKLGQKVILKQQAGVNGDNFFIAIDIETKKPLFIKPSDITERKDIPYQEWFNAEMNNYHIVKDEANNVAAKIEAPVQEGQEITLKDKTFYVSQVTADGISLNEIDEKGNLTEAELIVPPEDYEKVFGVPTDQTLQEAKAEPGQEIPQEAIQETDEESSQAPQFPVNKEGEIEYKKITEPEMYAQGLQQEFGEDAPAIVDELIAEQNEALKKAQKAPSVIERARKVKAINTELAKLAQVRDIINPQIEVKEEPGYDSENIQGLSSEVGGRQELEQAQPDKETGREEIKTGGILQEQGKEEIVQPIGEQPMAQQPSIPGETTDVEAGVQETGEGMVQPEAPEEQSSKPISAFKPGDFVRNAAGDVWEVIDIPTDENQKAVLRDIQDGSTAEWNQKTASWTLEKKEVSKEAQLIKAESEVDTRPTEAQKEAGNYKKGHLSIQGMEISIENPAGSIRKGTDKAGKQWSVMLNNTYGYFRRTKGKDGDQINVFIGDNLNPENVYIIDQVDPVTGQFDEHKVMLGFDSEQSAKENYLANYEPGWKGLGAITEMSIDDFKKWLANGTRTRKPVALELTKEETLPKSRLSSIDKMLNMTGQEIVNEWEELVYPIDLLAEKHKKQINELQKQKKATRKKDEKAKFDEKIQQLQNVTYKAYNDLENEYYERNQQLWQWIKSEVEKRGVSMPEETEDDDYYFLSELMNDIFERPGREVTWDVKLKDVFDEQFNGWVKNKVFASLKPIAEEKTKTEENKEPKAKETPVTPEPRDLTGFRKGDLVKNVQTKKEYEVVSITKVGKSFNVSMKEKGTNKISNFNGKRAQWIPIQKEIKIKGKEFVDKDGYYSRIVLNWFGGDKYAKVSLYDQEGNLADEISGMKASEILQNVNEGYWTEKEETPEEKPEFVGEYLKKHPGAFLKASDGSLDFGHIPAETGLKEAPIRLTEGNDSHGLLHIIEQHGEEIKKAGYKNVPSFVEDVAKNYTVIRAGTVYHDKPTFLLELVDKQNRTLIVELSRNGEYWNVNSAGIFRKGYSKNKKVVWSIPALGIKQSATTDDIAYPPENKSGTGKVSGNSPQTTSLEDKDTKKEETSQAPEQKKTEFAGEYLEKKPQKPLPTTKTEIIVTLGGRTFKDYPIHVYPDGRVDIDHFGRKTLAPDQYEIASGEEPSPEKKQSPENIESGYWTEKKETGKPKESPKSKTEFTFMADNPMGQGKALAALSKSTKYQGKLMKIYEFVESLEPGLKIETAKIHSSKAEKGYTEKLVIGDHIVFYKAEQDYYTYLQNGGMSYSDHLREKAEEKRIQDEKDAERRAKEREERAKSQQQQQKEFRAVMDAIYTEVLSGSISREQFIQENTQRTLDVIKQLEKRKQTPEVKRQLMVDKNNLESRIKSLGEQYDLVKRLYKLDNGKVVKKYDYQIGDDVIVNAWNKSTQTKIESLRENPDGSVTYIVEKHDDIPNQYLGYESLEPGKPSKTEEAVRQEEQSSLSPVQQKQIAKINKEYAETIGKKQGLISKAEKDMREALLKADERNGLFGDTNPVEKDEIIGRDEQGFTYNDATRAAVRKPFEEKIAELRKQIEELKLEQKGKIESIIRQQDLFAEPPAEADEKAETPTKDTPDDPLTLEIVEVSKPSQWLSGNSSYVNSAGLSSRRIANIINNFQNPAIPKEKKSAFRISRAGGKANNKPFQEFSDKDAIRAEKAAVKEFGTTEDWREVGYITFTGKKLDFSGKNDGGMPGERGYDHRQINSALDGIDLGKYETDKYWQDSASNGMYAFLDMGNIRVSSSFGGLAMTMMPTTEQFREIRNFIRLYNGMLSLDLNDTGVEYNKWTDEEQIINDIKRFYDEGIVPLPDFSAFRSNQPQGEALLESVIGGETPNYDRYLTNKITELGESFNTPITVVKNRYELPVRLQRQMQRDKVWNRRVTGLYDRQTGTIYVLLDDVKALGAERALDEVTKTVLHEIVAHKGLPKLLGEEAYNKLLDDLYWDIPQVVRALLMYEYSTDDKRTIAEEYLGMMAEDNINPNLFQRVLAKIRQLLRRLFRVSYSENDIRDMLRRSQENLRRPQTKDYEFAGEYLEDSVKEERSGSFRARQRVKQTLLEQAAEAYSEKEKKRQLSETMQGIREYFQDLNLPIRRFEEEVIKRGGQQDNQSKPYRDLNLSFGRYEKLYNDFFEEKMKPVLNAIAQLKKAGVPGENILPYIICKHAIERNAVMRGHELREWTDSNKNATFEDIEAQKEALKDKDYSGVMGFDKDGSYTNPDELARDIVKEFESQVQNKKLIDNLWSTTKAATNTILDAWEDGLQISPERKKEYQEQYRFYVPLRGWREGAAKDLVYTKGEGFSKSLRHAEGRKSLADNPLAYIQQVAFQAIAEQIDNEVKTSMSNLIIRNLKNNEIHELATIKKLYYVKVHLPDGTHEWEPTTDRPSPELFESGEATQKIYRAHERLRAPRQAKEHEVYVHRPGGDLVMIFKGKNLPVAQALNKQNYIYRNVFGHYDARDIDKAFMLMGHINNMLKSAYTSWNVVFPFTNFMRDFQEASITQAIKQGTGLKVIRNYKHAFPAIARHIAGRSDLKNPIDRELDDFYRLGGATGYTHLKTPEEIEKDINNEIKRMVREGTLRGDMQNSAITFLNAVEAWNRIFEDATRFAVYRASLAAGNTKEDAAIDAKEASVNFNRKGKGSKAWDSWFAFFNVALQSMQKNFSLAKHHPGRFSAVALSFITVGFIEAMMNALFDDDDDSSYYNINPYMRHNYLVIPNVISLIKGESKGDKYLSIPLPQFWRGFKSMGAIGFDIASKRTRVIDGIMDALGDFGSSLLPVDIGGFWKSGEFSFAPIMPTVIKPIVEVAENKNYMGYAIMNEPFTRDQKKILANAGLGKKNVSPAAKFFTDMLFRWGGGDTKYKYYYDEAKGRHRKVPGVLDINPSAIEHLFKGYTGGTGAVFSDMITTISQAFDPDEEIDFRNTPFVNRFIRKTPEAKWNIIKEYYDLRDDSKVTNLLSKEYWKSGSYDKAMSILGDEYSMKYIQTIKHYESALDDAAKAMDYDTIEGSDLTIELMRQCIIDIRDLKEEHGKK